MCSAQPGMLQLRREWIERLDRETTGPSSRQPSRSRLRLGVEALEPRFLLSGVALDDPTVTPRPSSTPVLLFGPSQSRASPPGAAALPAPATLVDITSRFRVTTAAGVTNPSTAAVERYLWHVSHLLTASRSSLSTSAAGPAGNPRPDTGQSGTDPAPFSEPMRPALTIGSVVVGPPGAKAAQGPQSGPENPLGTTLTAEDRTSAQMVPDLPHLTLFGSLNSADPSKVFDIPGDPTTRVAAIELLLASAGNIPLEMTVYNTSGSEIAELDLLPGSGPPVLSMSVPVNPSSQSPGVYVKVAASAGLEGSTATFSGPATDTFDLQVTQEPEAVLPVSQSPTPQAHLGNESSPLPTTARNVAPEAGLAHSDEESFGPDASEGERGPSSVVSSTPAGPGQQQLASFVVATGPLPERAGAPLGGVLAEGDPVPQLDRHAPALVDLALIGLPEPEPLPVLAEGDLRAIAIDREPARSAAKGVVPFRGPGGSPLLIPAQPGENRDHIDALVAVLPPAGATTVQFGSAVPAAPTAVPAKPAAGARPWSILSATALSSVTIVMAMFFGLVLPDMSRMMTVIETSRFRLRSLRR